MKGRPRSRRTRAVGVVIPVHNEEDLLGYALSALERALSCPSLAGIPKRVAVVLDSCRDDSPSIAKRWSEKAVTDRHSHQVLLVRSDASSVGRARGYGCKAILEAWPAIDPSRIWLATTDADSEVPPHWLASQVAMHDQGIDLWTGPVTVRDWSPHHDGETARFWYTAYVTEMAPTHGASLGFNADRYLRAGGFPAVATGEDRALYRSMIEGGALPWHDPAIPVVTSARREARAPLGFAHVLTGIADRLSDS
jgi:glycosyltransferase involved in cell wall biosynthesis